jgi:hypothetical protein
MKKTNIVKLLAGLFCCTAIFVACSKDPVDTTPAKVKKLMFDWKITAISVPKSGAPTTDSSLLKACMSDDIVRFNSTGFDFQDGASKCDTSIFYYSKGAWVYDLAADSIKLGATNPIKYRSWKVITLNDSILKVKFVDSLNPANKLTKTISFKH